MPKSNYEYPGYEPTGITYWSKTVLLYGAVTLGALWMIAPFWWALTTALSQNPSAGLVILFPENPTFDNFVGVYNKVPLGRWFLNSILLAGGVTVIKLVIDSLAGYAMARLDFIGREQLFLLIVGTMMIPGMVKLIPTFIILSELGWVNTYQGLMAPFVASPIGIFLLRQHFIGLPEALGEAGRLDGCNKFQVFYHIYLPLAKPALATLGIYTFMFAWKNFTWPLIIATSEEMFTLPVAAFFVRNQYINNWGLVMGAAIIMILPPIIVFLAAQRHFIRGMTLSGFKG
jgi:multiple sugar transport system permease protein